jgi:broad specificity phosphatase PhoE
VLERRVLPALRELLALPFEWVLVSHGEPVHTRADFERALEIDAWDKPDEAAERG